MPDWSRLTNLVMRTPRGEYVTAGTETAAFKALDAHRIELKPGVIATPEEQPDGRVVYLFTSATGDPMGSSECRCPAGYKGACGESWSEGSSIKECLGTCTHADFPYKTERCGWFTAGPKKLFGLIRI